MFTRLIKISLATGVRRYALLFGNIGIGFPFRSLHFIVVLLIDDIMSSNKEAEQYKASASKTTGCCRRLCTELSCAYRFYSLDEQDGNVLDINATFAPGVVDKGKQTVKGWGLFTLRLVMIAWISGPGITLNIYNDSKLGPGAQRYWPIYFTSLTGLLTLAYFVCISALHLSSLLGKGKSYLFQPESASKPASKFVRFIWTLYSIGAPCNLIVVLNYWVLVFNPATGSTASIDTITLHGISCALVLMDGNFISHIPIRAKHAALGFGYSCTLILWSIIHSFAKIGDGDKAGEDEDRFNEDDQIYSALDWKHNPKTAAINTGFTLLVVFPVCFVIVYFLSVWSCCPCGLGGSARHRLPAPAGARSDDGEVEAGAIAPGEEKPVPEETPATEESDIFEDEETPAAEESDIVKKEETPAAEESDIITKEETPVAEERDTITKEETPAAEESDIV